MIMSRISREEIQLVREVAMPPVERLRDAKEAMERVGRKREEETNRKAEEGTNRTTEQGQAEGPRQMEERKTRENKHKPRPLGTVCPLASSVS